MAVNSRVYQEPIAACTRSQVSLPPNLSPFKVQIQPLDEPVAARTRSRTGLHNFTTPSRSRYLEAQMLMHSSHSVLDNDTGNILNYGQLRKHPKYKETWNKYFSNEMGKLCQGVGKGKNGLSERVERTNTFYAIRFEDITNDHLNEICYTSVVCEVRPGKKDPNCTRIPICVTNICYPGDVVTNTASIELYKLIINNIL